MAGDGFGGSDRDFKVIALVAVAVCDLADLHCILVLVETSADHLCDGGFADGGLFLLAELGADKGLLDRLGLAEDGQEGQALAKSHADGIVDDGRVVAGYLKRRDGNDVLAFGIADAHGGIDLVLGGYVLDVDYLAGGGQIKAGCYLGCHFLRGAQNQDLAETLVLKGVEDFLVVGNLLEEGPFDGGEEVGFLFCALSCEYLVVLDQQAIVHDERDVVFVRNQLRPEALARAAAAYEGVDFDGGMLQIGKKQ